VQAGNREISDVAPVCFGTDFQFLFKVTRRNYEPPFDEVWSDLRIEIA
jgi:hypothetical protein